MLLRSFVLLASVFGVSKSSESAFPTFLLARDQIPNPSSESDPYVIVSFDARHEVSFAHFRPVQEILGQNIELALLDSSAQCEIEGPFTAKIVSKTSISANDVELVHELNRDGLGIQYIGLPIYIPFYESSTDYICETNRKPGLVYKIFLFKLWTC
jgi:hypothetical protein